MVEGIFASEEYSVLRYCVCRGWNKSMPFIKAMLDYCAKRKLAKVPAPQYKGDKMTHCAWCGAELFIVKELDVNKEFNTYAKGGR